MGHGGWKTKIKSGGGGGVSNKGKGKVKVNGKVKGTSLKNQIRSIERLLLRKGVGNEMREAQEMKLVGLKKQQELHNRVSLERQLFLRDRKIRFFERRKIERRIRRLEKHLRASASASASDTHQQLSLLKQDLQYVKFFPKTQKYVPLFTGDHFKDKINQMRNLIQHNIIAAAANGKDLEETASEDDGIADVSDDDFFVSGSSSEEADADADDELTDLSAREQGKAASGLSSDERNQMQLQMQKQKSARSLMPPPRPRKPLIPNNNNNNNRRSVNSQTGQSSNMSSNSDAPKRRRKRRPKKKKL